MAQPKQFSLDFASALEEKLNAFESGARKLVVRVESGNVYDKIVQSTEGNDLGGSVHAFVVKATGDLVKPAGWSAPQKSKRTPSGLATKFNISDPHGFDEAIEAVDRFGGYLYMGH